MLLEGDFSYPASTVALNWRTPVHHLRSINQRIRPEGSNTSLMTQTCFERACLSEH